MKKLLYVCALMTIMSFTACGNKTSESVDVVDTMVVDTLNLDTIDTLSI